MSTHDTHAGKPGRFILQNGIREPIPATPEPTAAPTETKTAKPKPTTLKQAAMQTEQLVNHKKEEQAL